MCNNDDRNINHNQNGPKVVVTLLDFKICLSSYLTSIIII